MSTAAPQPWKMYDPQQDPRVCKSQILSGRDERNRPRPYKGGVWVPPGRDPMAVLRRLAAEEAARR